MTAGINVIDSIYYRQNTNDHIWKQSTKIEDVQLILQSRVVALANDMNSFNQEQVYQDL